MYSKLSTKEDTNIKMNGEETSKILKPIRSMSKPTVSTLFAMLHGIFCAFIAATWVDMTDGDIHPEITDIFIPEIVNPLSAQRQTIQLKKLFSVNILWIVTALSFVSFIFNGWYAISAITLNEGVDDSNKYRSFENGITVCLVYIIIALSFGIQNIYTLFLFSTISFIQHWLIHSCEFIVFYIKRKGKETYEAHNTIFKIATLAFTTVYSIFLTEILRTIDGSSPDTKPFVIALFFMSLIYHGIRHLIQFLILIDGVLSKNPKRELSVYNGSLAITNAFFIITIQVIVFLGYRLAD